MDFEETRGTPKSGNRCNVKCLFTKVHSNAAVDFSVGSRTYTEKVTELEITLLGLSGYSANQESTPL